MRVGLIALGAALVLGCQAPPGRPEPEREVAIAIAIAEAEPVEPVEPDRRTDEEDALLAQARATIVGGELSTDARRRLAASDQPSHRRATRLLQAIAQEEPSPMPAPEPAPAPEPEPAPAPEPAPEPEPEPPEDDTKITEIDPRRFSPDSAIVAWLAGSEPIGPVEPVEPAFDPFAGLFAFDDPGPGVLLDLAWQIEGAGPRVILTRLAIVEAAAGVVRLEIIGAGPVGVRVQPLAAFRLRVRIDGVGAVPSFLAARPSRPELAVTSVRRGPGCVEVELEIAANWTFAASLARSNGAELQFSSP